MKLKFNVSCMTCSSLRKNTGNIQEYKEENGMERMMSVEGMMCTDWSGRVESVLNALPGVRAKVDLEKKIAVISAGAEVTNDALRKAVEDAGYTVKEIR